MTAYIQSLSRLYRIGLMTLMAAPFLILASCVDEKEQAPRGIIGLAGLNEGVQTVIETRADITTPNGYSKLDSVMSIKAYIFAFNKDTHTRESNTENDHNGVFSYKNNKWSSTLEGSHNFEYTLFAYSPDTIPAASVTLTSSDGLSAQLQMTDLKVITSCDPMASVAAAGGNAPGGTPTRITSFTEGSHNIGVAQVAEVTDEERTRVWLGMRHLYAKASIKFVVDPAYDLIRTIKVKEVKVKAASGTLTGTSTYTYANSTNLQGTIAWSTDAYSTPAASVNLLQDPTAPDDLFDTDPVSGDPLETITLSSTPKPFGWFCFLPKQKPSLTLAVKYDVYDKKGNLIRADQEVTNGNLLQNVPTAAQGLAAGNNYIITVRVNPTYLYQLGDGDTDLEIVIE